MRILLVDDEPIVRRDLQRLLSRQDDVIVVGTDTNGLEALEQIDTLRPDVVLLDVEMPELDGLGVAQALDPADAPLVVFVTAHDHYALAAFDAEAVDYLLKPFDAERVARALDRVRARLESRQAAGIPPVPEGVRRAAGPLTRLAVRTTDRAIVLAVDQIRRIEASGNYARIHVEGASYLTRRSMRDLAAMLDPDRFVRVHRSHIVAVDQVREYRLLGDGDAEVTLGTGDRITVTRSHREALEARLGGIA